jgi:predicted phage baseplate assembly protein
MTVPEVALDDLRFQELVTECRKRIAKSCPGWTEANVSDPGITLIELFAWMTDMLSYRINRLPEKLHVALLALLNVHLQPPEAARCELRFMLEHPPARPMLIPARSTEVATPRTQTQEPVVFQTSRDFTIHPAQPVVCLFERGSQRIEVNLSGGVALPEGEERFAFSEPPVPGDCLLLGFLEPLDRLVLRIEVDCKAARGVGVKPKEPPLEWQVSLSEGSLLYVSLPDGAWSERIEPLSDSTEGFNKQGRGSIELEMPARTGYRTIERHRLCWVRCRVRENPPPKAQGDGRQSALDAPENAYQSAPEIFYLTAEPVGATLPAEHCQRMQEESLGHSNGTPGETFRLRHAPVLRTFAEERLEVRDPDSREWAHWRRVQTFADSEADDPHYVLDETAGEIELGPVVRQPDGTFRRYGVVPKPRSELRFSAYRHGGGTLGNVAQDALTRLLRPIPGVSSVTNPHAARGGVDGESLALARARVGIELRTRERAVTADDFERVCLGCASRRVARARCLPVPGGGEGICVYVVPHVAQPRRALSSEELALDPDLREELERHLDDRRLVGTSVALKPPGYRAVKVVVQAVASRAVDTAAVERGILDALNAHLNPLIGGGDGKGWQFGRTLMQGELYPLVQGIEGVRQITLLNLYEVKLQTGEMLSDAPVHDLELEPEELIASGVHRVKVDPPLAL